MFDSLSMIPDLNMDLDQYFISIKPFIKKNIWVLSLGFLGMIFFAYGLIGLFLGNKTTSDDMVFEVSSEKNSIEVKTIFIDIEGAVVKPGVYKLPQESRIQDGLVAAGGLSASADRKFIAKNLNLATKLSDGAKIYIPAIGEVLRLDSGLNSFSQVGTAGGLVNINISSQTQLEALPGIGPVSALKIIAGRPYGSVDELLNKKIVGSKVFGQIKDKVTVY